MSQFPTQVSDLRYASPATVSRCGMVYVDPKNLGYNPYWQKWCNARGNDKEREELNRLFEKYVPPCIDLILEGIIEGKIGKKLKTIIPLTNLNMVGDGFVKKKCMLTNYQKATYGETWCTSLLGGL